MCMRGPAIWQCLRWLAVALGSLSLMALRFVCKQIMQSMQQYEKETAKMDMASEVMDDTLEGAMDADDTEEETGNLVNQVLCHHEAMALCVCLPTWVGVTPAQRFNDSQVLDEIGVDLTAKMASAPQRQTGIRRNAPAEAAEDAEADELTARLQALK